MAGNLLRIDGLEALREALKRLPPELVAEAGVIVHAHAEAAAQQMRAAYGEHRVTGNLMEHVKVELGGDKAHATARVRNTAKHAWIFEYGTRPRRHASGKSTGAMPSHHTLVAIAIARRRLMTAVLVDLVERSGLTVTGAGA